MKIAVFSDSHGRTEGMIKAVYNYGPDMIIHLGDYVRDTEMLKSQFPQTLLRDVRGNCDFMSSRPDTLIFNVGDKTILMTHGHKHSVKSGLESLIKAAQAAKADIVMFGHTHMAFHDVVSGMHILNPGTAGGSRQDPSYAQLEINPESISCIILPL